MTRADLSRAAGPFLVREIAYEPGTRMLPHRHDQPSITLVLAGGIRESVGSHEDDATPLSVVVKPAGVRHADEFGPRGARTLQIAWREDPGAGAGVFSSGWRWSHMRRGVPEFLALAEDARASGSSAGHLESRVWDVLAALEGASDPPRDPPAPDAPRWIERIREEIDDRIGEGIEVRELAASVGLHPGSLARAFRRHFGESITGYRTRERLRRAVASLARCERSMSAIAHEAGFADHPHFCRAVREGTGRTPSELQRVVGFSRAG